MHIFISYLVVVLIPNNILNVYICLAGFFCIDGRNYRSANISQLIEALPATAHDDTRALFAAADAHRFSSKQTPPDLPTAGLPPACWPAAFSDFSALSDLAVAGAGWPAARAMAAATISRRMRMWFHSGRIDGRSLRSDRQP